MPAKKIEPPLEHIALDGDPKVKVAFDPALSFGSNVDHERAGGDTRVELPRLDPIDPVACNREDLLGRVN